MIFYVLLFIAGIILFYTLYEDIEKYLKLNISKNIFFPLFIIILIFFGLVITQHIHSSEIITRNVTPQQNVSFYWCFLEMPAECNSIVNEINNKNISEYDGRNPAELYIPLSFIYNLQRNMFSYFMFGLLLSWIINFIMMAVKINGR